MATYYWVGGNGNWGYSETTNWASSSGGAGGAGFPTPYDNVVFDANSNTGTAAFAVTVTGVAAAPSTCANFDASAVDGVMTLTMGATAVINGYGSWVNPASNFAYSITSGAALNFKATALGKTVSFNSVSLGALAVTFDGVGGGWTLSTAIAGTSAITVTNGSFDTGNQTISAAQFSSANTNTRSITLGSSTLNLSGAAPWNTGISTNLTLSPGTSTVNCSSAASISFSASAGSFYNVNFTDTTGINATITISGVITYNNLTFASPSVAGVKLIAFSANQVINGTLTLGSGGTASNRLWVLSSTNNAQRNITAATLAAMSDVDFQDVAVLGAAAPFTGTRIGNRGNTSGITFTAAKTVYWSLVGGGNWSDTVWATSSGGTPAANNFPLAQDTAIIDATGLNNTSTVTINQNYWAMPALNVTKTGAFTIVVGNLSPAFYGDVTLQAATTTTGGTGYWTLVNAGTTTTLTTNGATISTSGVAISSQGGTVQLGSALTTTGNIIVSFGTFSTANYAVSAAALQSTNTNTRTVSLGSSTVTLSSTLPVDFTTTTGLTFNAGTSTINCSSGNLNFNVTGQTYYNVGFTSSTAGTSPAIVGAVTFNNLSITSPATAGYRTLNLASNITVNGTLTLGVGGTATNRVRVSSSVTGTTRTVTAAALATMSDVDFSDITAAGASGTWSGTRIGNIGRNSNITFTAAKTVYWNLAGAQNWSATGWAATSGGTPAVANFPLPQDTATFDNTGSVTGTITFDTNYYTGSINVTKTGAMTLAVGATSQTITGNLTFQAATTITATTGSFSMVATGTQVVTSNGATCAALLALNNYAGGTTQLGSNFTTTNTSNIVHTIGTFDLNGFNLTAAGLSSTTTNTRALLLGSGTHTFSGATPWDVSTNTNLTLTSGTSTITCSNAAPSFLGGSQTYYNVSFTSSAGGTVAITGSNTYNNLTFTSPATASIKLITVNSNQTVGATLTLGVGGTATNRLVVVSSLTGTQFTITAATLAAMSDVDFRDIASAGAAAPFTGTRVGNLGNNSNITFTAAKTVYWSLAAGGTWQSSTAWATSSGGAPAIANFPLAQDTAIIDDTGITTGNTITIAGANVGTLNVTKTAAVTLAFGSQISNFAGSVTLQAATVVTGTNTWNFYTSTGTPVLSTNGSVLPVPIALAGGNLQLGTAVTTTSTFTLTTGALDLNNKTLTAATFTNNNSTTRSIAFGSTGNITLTGNNQTVCNMSTMTGFSFTGTSAINLTYSGSVGTRVIISGNTAGATESNVMNFNVTAGGDIVSFTTTGQIKSLNLTGFAGSIASTNKGIFGNLTVPTTTAFTAGTSTTSFTGTTGVAGTQVITTNGVVLDFNIVFSGTATYQLAGNFSAGGSALTSSLTSLISGTIDLNGYVLSAWAWGSNYSSTRAIAFNGGSISIIGNNQGVWSMATATGFTYTGTSIINLTYSGSVGTRSVAMGVNGGNETYAMNFNVTAGSDIYSHTVTAKNLNLTGFSGTYANVAKNIFGNFTMPAGVTVAAGTNTVNFAATSGTQVITTNGVTQDYPINLNGAAATTYQFADALTTGSTRQLQLLNGIIKFKAGTINTVGSFATSGTNQKYLQSDTAGARATISQASGTVNANYLTIQDSAAAGGAVFNAYRGTTYAGSQNNINGGNNTGWNFIPTSRADDFFDMY